MLLLTVGWESEGVQTLQRAVLDLGNRLRRVLPSLIKVQLCYAEITFAHHIGRSMKILPLISKTFRLPSLSRKLHLMRWKLGVQALCYHSESAADGW